MKKVFLCEYIHPDAYELLKNHVDIIHFWEEFPEADAMINRNIKMTAELFAQTNKLKVIGIHGTGTDDVDLEEAFAKGIDVFSVPHVNARSVAEMNVALMLSLGRKIILSDRMLKADLPEGYHSMLQGTEFHGKTLGLIGLGDINMKTAQICRLGFGMKVIAWSRHFDKVEAEALGFHLYSVMDRIFEEADIVMIGLNLDKSTRKLIGKAQFEKMKKDAFLINTSRGAIIDEEALYCVLKERRIGGAACDVFEEEPLKPSNPLLTLDNFIATPHLGANTNEALRNVGMAVVKGILKRLNIME